MSKPADWPMKTTPWRWRFGVFGGVVLALLSGCASVGSDYQTPKPQLPSQWQGRPIGASTTTGTTELAAWWQRFHDRVLDRLMDDALKANVTLASARAKLREARARRNLAEANLGPSVDASGSASRSKSSGASSTGGTHNLYNAGFDASWEPDVFGGGHRRLEAAEADVQAEAEALHETRVSLAAEVARNYIDLRTAERRLAVAQSSLKAQSETYDLVRWRRRAGLATELAEMQALTQLEQTRATLPTLQTTIRTARNRLAILLDRPPGAVDALLKVKGEVKGEGDDKIPVASDRIAVGIPADTLRQRPDVRAAERRLAAETARLGAAQAARYPSFQLSGTLGLQALTPGGLFDSASATRSLLAGITAPIFDSGRIRSQIEIQDAVLEQARLNYQSTVLTALEDVENALENLDNSRLREARLRRATASAQLAWEIARYRYQSGLVDFQSVLDSQRTLLNLQDQLTTAEGAHSDAQIQLYKALGGGWSNDDQHDGQSGSHPKSTVVPPVKVAP